LVFELVSTKLPHYTLPLFPALAILSARAVFVAQAGLLPGIRAKAARIGTWLWLGIGWAATLAVLARPAGVVAVSLAFHSLPRISDVVGSLIVVVAALVAA